MELRLTRHAALLFSDCKLVQVEKTLEIKKNGMTISTIPEIAIPVLKNMGILTTNDDVEFFFN